MDTFNRLILKLLTNMYGPQNCFSDYQVVNHTLVKSMEMRRKTMVLQMRLFEIFAFHYIWAFCFLSY